MVELDEQIRKILRDSSLTPYDKFMFASESLKQPGWTVSFWVKWSIWALLLGGLYMSQVTYDFLDDTTIDGMGIAFFSSFLMGSVPSAIVCIFIYELPRQRRNDLISELQMVYASSRDGSESTS